MIPVRERIGFCVCPPEGRDMDTGKFLSRMHSGGLRYFGVKEAGGRLYGYVTSGGFKKLCTLAEDMGLSCFALTKSGVSHALGGYRRRWGIVIGAVLSAVIAAVLSGRVTVIEIGGSDVIPEEQVLSLLRDVGIYIGCDINDVDLREAERRITAMDKDIAWIGIRHTGSRVVVEVQDIDPYPAVRPDNTPCNIVAARDAQIKQVRVWNGMLIPMVGDGVRKGEVIVSGVVDTKYGHSYYVHAVGEITGIYTEQMTFTEEFRDTETVTDRVITRKALSLFGHRLIYASEGDPAGNFEYSEHETPLTLGKIVFPVSAVEMIYKLQKEIPVTRSAEEVRRIIGERTARYEQNFLTEGVTVTDKQVEDEVTALGITRTVTYTVEGEIGTERMIFAKDDRGE